MTTQTRHHTMRRNSSLLRKKKQLSPWHQQRQPRRVKQTHPRKTNTHIIRQRTMERAPKRTRQAKKTASPTVRVAIITITITTGSITAAAPPRTAVRSHAARRRRCTRARSTWCTRSCTRWLSPVRNEDGHKCRSSASSSTSFC